MPGTPERTSGNLQCRLQLSQQLDERTVTTGWARWTFRRGGIVVAHRVDRCTRRLHLGRDITNVRPSAAGADQGGKRSARLGGFPAQGDPLEPWPEEDSGQGRDNARNEPAAETPTERREGNRNGHRQQKRELQCGLCCGHIVSKHAGELDPEADEQHTQHGPPGTGGGQRAECDQQRANHHRA